MSDLPWRPADSLTANEWTAAFYKVCIHITNYTSICLKRSPEKAEYTKRKQMFPLGPQRFILMWLITKAAGVKCMRTLWKHIMNTICHVSLLAVGLHRFVVHMRAACFPYHNRLHCHCLIVFWRHTLPQSVNSYSYVY